MTASELTLARFYAKKAIKAQWQSQGIRWVHVEASKLNQAATVYLSEHREELIERARTLLKQMKH